MFSFPSFHFIEFWLHVLLFQLIIIYICVIHVCAPSSYSVSVAESSVSTAMATCTEKTKKKETQIPPRRGRVRAQIFESIVKTVASAVSKTKEKMGKQKREGYDGKSCSSSSTTSTPPQSGYTSEGNGHIS